MVKKVAFIFPGQGSQYSGMGFDAWESFDVARHVYDVADNVLGRKISQICFTGSDEELKLTQNTQPVIVATSLALLESLKTLCNIEPVYTAGHSLGEYCAMYLAGVMSLETTFLAIQKRADLMGEVKGGSMSAILNASEDAINTALQEASKIGYVGVANYNSPVQTVITGDEDAVKIAGEIALQQGARRVVPLAVSGAFHSKYMENAGEKFKDFVNNLTLSDAKIPVITNVDATPTTEKEDFRRKMPQQIYSSVRWVQTIEKMIADGVETFVEIGAGSVLAGLNKKINPQIQTLNVSDKKSLEEVAEILNKE